MRDKFLNQVEPYVTPNEAQALYEYMRSGFWLSEFVKTQELECKFGDLLGIKNNILVPNGTIALYLSLLAAGIGPGDTVLVPNITMIATPNAVLWTGATVKLVDVDSETLCMDLSTVVVEPNCKAVLYVSLNGRSGDMFSVQEFCRSNGLRLIEDSCQALGSKHHGKFLGTFGDIGNFSFTPHKIITMGQGGLIVTDDDGFAERLRRLKDFDRVAPAVDWHNGLGFNFKFTDIQAVVGLEQIRTIAERMRRKREIFNLYAEKLSSVDEITFKRLTDSESVPWTVDIFLESEDIRNSLADYLKAKNIGTRRGYPPLSHQSLYEGLGCGAFPVSETMALRCLWLPCYFGLENDDIDLVCCYVKKFFAQ